MSAPEWSCVGFGLCAFDTLLLVERYPELNQKTDALALSQQGGGPVATAMATLGRLGQEGVAFVGKVGDDWHGRFVLEAFRADHVDTSFVRTVPGAPTAHAFVWIERISGKRSVVLYRDEKVRFRADELEPSPFEQTKVLLIDGRDPDASLRAAAWARRAGAEVVMDAGSMRPRLQEFFRSVDHFVASRDFLHAFRPGGNLEEAVREIHRAGPKCVVITLGEQGAVGFDGREFVREPAFKVKVVDTTGAGDVFHGAYIFALLRKVSFRQRIVFANAVAALKCLELGGRKGIPHLTETIRFLQRELKLRNEETNWLKQLEDSEKGR